MSLRIVALAGWLLIAPAAAQDVAQSPTCALLSAEEVATFTAGAAEVQDGGPESGGASACTWLNMETGRILTAQRMGPQAFAGSGITAAGYLDMLATGMRDARQAFEEVPGLADRAILQVNGGLGPMPGGNDSFIVAMVRGETLVTLAATALTREQTLEASHLIAGRM